MNSARIALKLALDAVDIPIRLDTFSHRLQLQKKIYLVQVSGLDLGYRFSWYLRGPYSTGLAADAFALQDDIELGDDEWRQFDLAEPERGRLKATREMFECPVQFGESTDDWLELLTSLHYLRHIAYHAKGASREFADIFELLASHKPKLRDKRVQTEQAWGCLESVGLIASKTLSI